MQKKVTFFCKKSTFFYKKSTFFCKKKVVTLDTLKHCLLPLFCCFNSLSGAKVSLNLDSLVPHWPFWHVILGHYKSKLTHLKWVNLPLSVWGCLWEAGGVVSVGFCFIKSLICRIKFRYCSVYLSCLTEPNGSLSGGLSGVELGAPFLGQVTTFLVTNLVRAVSLQLLGV